jgi:hypothetical protein
MHLSPEELLDLAEGTRPIASAPHLAGCEVCRQQLDELRGVIATLQIDVPEPSPMFWEHLSTRVRDAVAAEAVPARRWFGFGRWSWGLAAAMSAAVAVIAVSLTLPTPPAATHVPSANSQTSPAVAAAPGGDVGSAPAIDDASLSLLGDLAGGLDWDGAAEAGISMAVGTADTAVVELNQGERSELQRLLREAIGPSHSGA